MERKVAYLSLALFLAVSACSCSPRHLFEYRDNYIHDTTYVSKTETQLEYVRDSIFIREKGDTVYQYVEKWRYRDREVHDTVYQNHRDTVMIESVTVKEVAKPLTAWQRMRMLFGDLAAIGILLFLLYELCLRRRLR